MIHDFTTIFQLLGLGALVAVLSTWIGVGGGLVVVPALPMLLGASGLEAVGTSLATIFLVACSNAYSFSRKGNVLWKEGLSLGLAATLTGVITGRIITEVSELTLKVIFGITLLGLLPISLGPRRTNTGNPVAPSTSIWVAVGLLCGVVSGSTGLGAGLVAIPLLDRMQMVGGKYLVPTVSVMILLNTLASLCGLALGRPEFHAWRIGPIWVDAALWIVLGSQLVSPFTIRVADRFPARLRRRILTTILVIVSLKTWYEAYRLWQV